MGEIVFGFIFECVQALIEWAWRSVLIIVGLSVAVLAYLSGNYVWVVVGLVAAFAGALAIYYRKPG